MADDADIALMRAKLAEAWQQANAAGAQLSDKLALYEAKSRALLPQLLAAYDRMVARVAGNAAAELAPAPGDLMPDFLFPDQDGHLVDLSALWREQPLVISFNRGHWCPYCRFEIGALAAAAPKIAEAGAGIVSIVPETAEFSSRMLDTAAAPFAALSDVDLSYALLLGLVVPVGAELQSAYGSRGIDLPRFQGNGAWLLPIPATFVVGRSGRVVARFVDAEFRRRMNIEDILAAVRTEVSRVS